jgi:hypothetical protein
MSTFSSTGIYAVRRLRFVVACSCTFLLLSSLLPAAVVVDITTDTPQELVGSIAWDNADVGMGFFSVGELTINTGWSSFQNLPGNADDQAFSIFEGFGGILTFRTGEVLAPPTVVGDDPLLDPIAGMGYGPISGTYTNGFNGGTSDGTVDFEMVMIGTAAGERREASFSFVVVPEPTQPWLLLSLGFLGFRRWKTP